MKRVLLIILVIIGLFVSCKGDSKITIDLTSLNKQFFSFTGSNDLVLSFEKGKEVFKKEFSFSNKTWNDLLKENWTITVYADDTEINLKLTTDENCLMFESEDTKYIYLSCDNEVAYRDDKIKDKCEYSIDFRRVQLVVMDEKYSLSYPDKKQMSTMLLYDKPNYWNECVDNLFVSLYSDEMDIYNIVPNQLRLSVMSENGKNFLVLIGENDVYKLQTVSSESPYPYLNISPDDEISYLDFYYIVRYKSVNLASY